VLTAGTDNTLTSVSGGTYWKVNAGTGLKTVVRNRTGVLVNILPPTGAQFETAGTNTAITLPNNATFTVTMKTSTQGRID
jgi:hypothetical protein